MSAGNELEIKLVFGSPETQKEIREWVRSVIHTELQIAVSGQTQFCDQLVYNLNMQYHPEIERLILSHVKAKLNGDIKLY